MTYPTMLQCDVAIRMAALRGMFARRSSKGPILVFYTGDETDLSTWMEAGRTIIDDDEISRHAFELITAN